MNLERTLKAEEVVERMLNKLSVFVTEEVCDALGDASYLTSEVRRFRWSWDQAAEVGKARCEAGLASTVEEGAKQVRTSAIDRLVHFLTA